MTSRTPSAGARANRCFSFHGDRDFILICSSVTCLLCNRTIKGERHLIHSLISVYLFQPSCFAVWSAVKIPCQACSPTHQVASGPTLSGLLDMWRCLVRWCVLNASNASSQVATRLQLHPCPFPLAALV